VHLRRGRRLLRWRQAKDAASCWRAGLGLSSFSGFPGNPGLLLPVASVALARIEQYCTSPSRSNSYGGGVRTHEDDDDDDDDVPFYRVYEDVVL